MAEDMIELGLEGFDKLIDKYHDKAYDTATDSHGRIWKKIHLPGQRKRVYMEQNPQAGQEAQFFDPAKDQVPHGFKMDRDTEAGPRGRNDTLAQADYDHENPYRGERGTREPAYISQQDYYDESPRKPYPNEMPRYPNPGPREPWRDPRGYTYRDIPQEEYYPPPPNQGYGNYHPQPQSAYPPEQYAPPGLATAAVGGAALAANNRGFSPRADSEDRLSRQRTHDPHPRGSYDSFSPPRRRRTKSVDPRADRRKSKDVGGSRRESKDFSLGASLAGAVAGGLLGRQLGKGDFLSTTAGAVAGAIGGDIAAGGGGKKDKDRERERRGSRRDSKSYDKLYKDRY